MFSDVHFQLLAFFFFFNFFGPHLLAPRHPPQVQSGREAAAGTHVFLPLLWLQLKRSTRSTAMSRSCCRWFQGARVSHG